MDGEAVGFGAVAPELPMANIPSVINRERILEAQHILREYKAGKANLEQRIVANEQWYKLRHWELMRSKESGQQVEPVSAWLFNSIANKHADAMDNYPCPNLLPREEGDKKEAEALSSIVPVLLDQCEFEDVYSEAWDDKLRGGTAVYGVFWDPTAFNEGSKAGDLTEYYREKSMLEAQGYDVSAFDSWAEQNYENYSGESSFGSGVNGFSDIYRSIRDLINTGNTEKAYSIIDQYDGQWTEDQWKDVQKLLEQKGLWIE